MDNFRLFFLYCPWQRTEQSEGRYIKGVFLLVPSNQKSKQLMLKKSTCFWLFRKSEAQHHITAALFSEKSLLKSNFSTYKIFCCSPTFWTWPSSYRQSKESWLEKKTPVVKMCKVETLLWMKLTPSQPHIHDQLSTLTRWYFCNEEKSNPVNNI